MKIFSKILFLSLITSNITHPMSDMFRRFSQRFSQLVKKEKRTLRPEIKAHNQKRLLYKQMSKNNDDAIEIAGEILREAYSITLPLIRTHRIDKEIFEKLIENNEWNDAANDVEKWQKYNQYIKAEKWCYYTGICFRFNKLEKELLETPAGKKLKELDEKYFRLYLTSIYAGEAAIEAECSSNIYNDVHTVMLKGLNKQLNQTNSTRYRGFHLNTGYKANILKQVKENVKELIDDICYYN